MSEVGSVIRQIRNRLHLTTREFAEKLGVRHTAVSRYERNEMQPGFLPLRAILKLAEGTERNPILERLARLLERSGLGGEAVLIQSRRAGALVDLASRGWHLVLDESIQTLQSPPPHLLDFADVSAQIVGRGKEIDPSLVKILALWLDHDTTDGDVRGYFADAAKFLAVSLTTWKARRSEGLEGPSADGI